VNAEIIAVGSEMLTPSRVDTNSLYLTGQLNNLGVEVVVKYVVGDDRDRLASTIRLAASHSEIVILSGGLGPTEDDVTRDALALAIERRQIFHPEIAEQIEQRFYKMGRRMVDNNKRQAFILEGAEILPNDRGTAPGQWVEDSGRVLMMLPGPPHELKAMFERQCLSRLGRIVPRQAIETLIFRVTGMGESDLDHIIAPVYKKYANPATTVLAHNGDIQVHLRARCNTKPEALALLAAVGGQIEALLGDRIYSRNGDSLEATVGEMLRKQRATIAVAESVTAGGLADRISSVAGASDYFVGGFITYARTAKTEMLGVDPELLQRYGPVSKEVAEAMALGARRRTNATYALALTGNAGPTTDGDQAPVGMVYIGLASPTGVISTHRQFLGDRPRIRAFAAQMSLDFLRRNLTS
jgi:nicotinamide-nucleotide amidase